MSKFSHLVYSCVRFLVHKLLRLICSSSPLVMQKTLTTFMLCLLLFVSDTRGKKYLFIFRNEKYNIDSRLVYRPKCTGPTMMVSNTYRGFSESRLVQCETTVSGFCRNLDTVDTIRHSIFFYDWHLPVNHAASEISDLKPPAFALEIFRQRRCRECDILV